MGKEKDHWTDIGELLFPMVGPVAAVSPLYHYTSAAGVFGIVRSGTIWASNTRYLNDSQEFGHALGLAGKGINARVYRDEAVSNEFYYLLLGALEEAPRTSVYAASFSEKGDQLSQWRAYCPPTGGFAVGFDATQVASSSKCYLAQCIYDVPKQERLLEFVLETMKKRFKDLSARDHGQVSQEGKDEIVREYSWALSFLGGIFKDPGFSEESEWRLIQTSDAKDFRPSFREGRSGVVPYLSLRVQPEGGERSLRRIVVGPNPHPHLAISALEEFLRTESTACERLVASAVPYRTW